MADVFSINYRFTLPEYNIPGWNTKINNNFIAIDALLAQFTTGITLVGIWANSTSYVAGQTVIDSLTGHIWTCANSNTSSVSPGTFAADRAAFPLNWTDITNPAVTAAASATAAAASATSATASSGVNVGRNFLHNGLFRVQQRGVGPFTTNLAFTADRWQLGVSTSTISTTVASLTDADRTALANEAAEFGLQIAAAGTAGAADYLILTQRSESVKRFAGKTITISFYAKTNVAASKIGLEFVQNFGSGGAPSASVTTIGSQTFTLTTTWTRYTATVAVPTIIGKTFGTTAGTDYFELNFWLSSGATWATRSGGVGVQVHTLSVWGMQGEIAAAVSPLEIPNIRYDFSNCQRFYEVCNAWWIGDASIGATYGASVPFAVEKRATPTLASLSQAGAGNSQMNVRIGASLVAPTRGAIWVATAISTGIARGFSDTFSATSEL